MIRRIILGITKFGPLFSHKYTLRCINTGKPVRTPGLVDNGSTRCKLSAILTNFSSQNITDLSMDETNSLVKAVLYNRHILNGYDLDRVFVNLHKNHPNDPLVSLDTLYHLLLLNRSDGLSPTKCVEILDSYRLCSDVEQQLKFLDISYAIRRYHSHIEEAYTSQIKNYIEYLRLLSPKIKLQSGIGEESEELKDVKNTMDEMNLEYSSGITGHLYSPIILKGTNMIIDVCYERDKYEDSDDFTPDLALKEYMLREMGWKVRFIPVDHWRLNRSEEEKKEYLSRFITKYYLDTQFSEIPLWVSI